VRALVGDLPAARQALLTEAIARKNDAEIAQACETAGASHADALQALPWLHGGREALVEGLDRLAKTPAVAAARRLLALFDAAAARGFEAHLTADLGEVRGFAYYTGTVLHAYAAGTGDAVVSGGRYDELLARFGWDLPAAGFAIDLDRAAEALRAAAVASEPPARAVVVGPADDGRLAELRARGVAAVACAEATGAFTWARAWGFTHVLDSSGWVDAASGASIAPPLSREERGQK